MIFWKLFLQSLVFIYLSVIIAELLSRFGSKKFSNVSQGGN